MPRLPFLGRLTIRDYAALVFGGLFVALETVLTFIISFLPKSVIEWFYDRSRTIFHLVVGPPIPKSDEQRLAERIRRAEDFQKLCIRTSPIS